MHRNLARILTASACLAAASCSREPASVNSTDESNSVGETPASGNININPLNGLWSGSWGGEEFDGVVIQPAVVELMILGDQVEMSGLPGATEPTGTLDIDAGQIVITESGNQQPPQVIRYGYELEGDIITLTAESGDSFQLERRAIPDVPFANVEVEFVTATGISAEGELLIIRYGVLQAGTADAAWFSPRSVPIELESATVLRMQDTGLVQITTDEARGFVSEATPVVMAHFRESQQSRNANEPWRLWRTGGAPSPESEPVRRMLARIVRPGTLVLIVPDQVAVP